jgi:hypothetical protein
MMEWLPCPFSTSLHLHNPDHQYCCCRCVLCSEARYGALLSPYLSDPSNLFIISSDFCHWGSRFRYTFTNKEQVRPEGQGSSKTLCCCCWCTGWLCLGQLCTYSYVQASCKSLTLLLLMQVLMAHAPHVHTVCFVISSSAAAALPIRAPSGAPSSGLTSWA